jgi:hypothetical protein
MYMNFKQWLEMRQWLEMSMSINKVGDWQSAQQFAKQAGQKRDELDGWDRSSIRTFSNSKANKKMVKRFENVPHDFNVYLVIGKDIDPTRTYASLASQPDDIYNALGITPEQAPIVPNKINIFFSNWSQDPPSPWMIAHRFAHSFHGNYGITQVLSDLASKADGDYEKTPTGWDRFLVPSSHGTIRTVVMAIGTMKSARDGHINLNEEAVHELVAQYILQGKVVFLKNSGDYLNSLIQQCETKINAILAKAMKEATKIVYSW